MNVMTVTGPVPPEDLGLVLPHEHVFLDLRNQFTEFDDPEKRRASHQPLSRDNADRARQNPYAIRDNLLLDDFEAAVSEVLAFKEAGGQTLIDCTSIGIRRDPERLRALSLRTGLFIVAGCGYYTRDTHPADMGTRSVAALAAEMIADLTDGIGATGIRAGIIGEIGTSHPIHPDERKNLEAAAEAHRATGAAIMVHTYPWGREGAEAADLLLRERVPASKIVICHTDVEPDGSYIRELLARGVFVEFDDFGKEFIVPEDERGFAGGSFFRDEERVVVLRQLVDEGFEGQLLLTNDICLKCMLHRYGGKGYDHIVTSVVPMMRAAGIAESAVQRILRENPHRLLG